MIRTTLQSLSADPETTDESKPECRAALSSRLPQPNSDSEFVNFIVEKYIYIAELVVPEPFDLVENAEEVAVENLSCVKTLEGLKKGFNLSPGKYGETMDENETLPCEHCGIGFASTSLILTDES